jgi:AcrR family transcriptional regulator
VTTADDGELRRRPRQRRSRDTVAFVLEAAAQLFAERGYETTTTNAVAERAGVSIGTLYQYFASKDGLLLGLLEEHLDDVENLMIARIRATPAQQPGDLAAALVHQTADRNARRPQLARLLHEQAPHSPRVRARRDHLRRSLTSLLVDRLAGLAEVGPTTGESRLRADLCTRLVEHLVHATALDPPPRASRAEVLEHITAVATACLRDGTSPPAAQS